MTNLTGRLFLWLGALLKRREVSWPHDPRLHAQENIERFHFAAECLPAAVGSHPVAAFKPVVQTFIRPDMNDLADVANLGREETDQFAEEFLLKRKGLAFVQRKPFSSAQRFEGIGSDFVKHRLSPGQKSRLRRGSSAIDPE